MDRAFDDINDAIDNMQKVHENHLIGVGAGGLATGGLVGAGAMALAKRKPKSEQLMGKALADLVRNINK